MKWLADNWLTVSLGITVAINLINGLTSHFKAHPKAIRWLSAIVEILSVVRSLNVPGLVKPPLTSRPPAPGSSGIRINLFWLAFLPIAASSCSHWSHAPIRSVNASKAGLDAVASISRTVWAAKCRGLAKLCRVPAAECKSLGSCKTDWRKFDGKLKTAYRAVDAARAALAIALATSAADAKHRATALVTALLTEFAVLTNHAKAIGVFK